MRRSPEQTGHPEEAISTDSPELDERVLFGRRSVLLVIVNVVITAGVFHPIWVLLRRKELNCLAGPPIGWVAPTFVAIVYAVGFFWAVIGDSGAAGAASVSPDDGALKTFDFVGLVLVILVMLSVRNRLVGHYRLRYGKRLVVSRLWTILFGAIYLQHCLNELPAPPSV